MEMATLQLLAFSSIIFFIIAYVIMDGFDLGVGSLYLLAPKTDDRRILLNSIGPFWDGNEVWLLIFGAGLFGVFPLAYASIFSGFYLLFLLFALGLIFRAAAIEFRGKRDSDTWKSGWDIVFAVASTVITFGLGVVIGNIISGVPLDGELRYIGGRLFTLLTPYAILCGATLWSICTLHGSIFLMIKTEGDLLVRVKKWYSTSFIITVFFYVAMLLTTFKLIPHFKEFASNWGALEYSLLALNVACVAAIPLSVAKDHYIRAFTASSLMIASIIALFGITYFPNILVNLNDPAHHMTVYNTSGSYIGLRNFLCIVLFAIPANILYTAYVHKVFAGKVKLDKTSY